MFKFWNRINFRIIDLVPAFSGLIGKTALVTSFAFVWAQELSITTPGFVFENVRIEMMIAGIITFIFAILLPKTAPAGTLSPLIILVPAMAAFGVHPLILSVLVGVLGIVSVKTGMLKRLIQLSGKICKSSLPLVFGISGVILSADKLLSFFKGYYIPLLILFLILFTSYILLFLYKRSWMIIPIAAVASVLIPFIFGLRIDVAATAMPLNFNPYYWWQELWGIGFGLNIDTILRTLPFAVFVVILWAVDTISINAIIDTNFSSGECREEIDTDNSFIVVSVRNIIGGICGGAQTGALWRSYLIPLFMVKRPIRSSAILLGLMAIIASITSVPIKIMSFPPLIWSVLLFGIFVPFIIIGIKNLKTAGNISHKLSILILTAVGVVFSPMLTWIGAVCYEKITEKINKK